MIRPDKQWDRLTMIILFLITFLIIIVVLAVISGAIIVYQIYLLVLAMLYPVIGLMAVFPRFRRMFKNWGKKILKAAFMKFGYSFLLIIIFIMSSLARNIAGKVDGYGIYWSLFLQLIIILGILYKRNEIFGFMNTQASSFENFASRGARMVMNAPRQAINTYRKGKKLIGGVKRGDKRTAQFSANATRTVGRGARAAARGTSEGAGRVVRGIESFKKDPIKSIENRFNDVGNVKDKVKSEVKEKHNEIKDRATFHYYKGYLHPELKKSRLNAKNKEQVSKPNPIKSSTTKQSQSKQKRPKRIPGRNISPKPPPKGRKR
jgi:hypothetical protein